MVSLNRLFVGEMASFFSFSLFICRAILLSSNLSVIFPNFANSAVQKGVDFGIIVYPSFSAKS